MVVVVTKVLLGLWFAKSVPLASVQHSARHYQGLTTNWSNFHQQILTEKFVLFKRRIHTKLLS